MPFVKPSIYMAAIILNLSSFATDAVAESNQTKTAAAYEQQVSELCSENRAPIKRAKGSQVFSWTDEKGNVHFGDRPPANVNAESKTFQGRKDYFDTTITFPSGGESADLRESLTVNGQAIAQAFSQFVLQNVPKHRSAFQLRE